MKRPILWFCNALLLIHCGSENKNPNYGKYTRAELRYYAYAPPFIPHDVINKECLDCHLQGMVVEGFTAKVTPHPEFANCQQCHVRADEKIRPFRPNTFVGLAEPKSLQRPQPSGPPLMPHRLFMRENCLVCHKDASRKEIIQTTHPERSNCQQCHVPQDAQVDLFRENTNVADAVSR